MLFTWFMLSWFMPGLVGAALFVCLCITRNKELRVEDLFYGTLCLFLGPVSLVMILLAGITVYLETHGQTTLWKKK